jgi:hypothetical protein
MALAVLTFQAILLKGVNMNQKHAVAIGATAVLALLASTAHAVTTINLGTINSPEIITNTVPYTSNEIVDFKFTIDTPFVFTFTNTANLDDFPPITETETGEAGVYTLSFGPIAETGSLTYTLSTLVPEPATWALMLVGFGGLGAAMRARRRAIAAV